MKKLLITLMAIVPFIANAGFYAEPYLGYGMGDYENKAGSNADEIGSVVGARLGGSFLGIIGGLEYSKETMALDYKTSSVTDKDADITDMGVFVGYQFPSVIPLLGKVWGSYFFNSDIDVDGTKADGTGLALGLGLAPIPVPLPFLSIHFNLEYRTHEWERDDTAKTKWNDSQYLFSISIPINI